MRTRYLHDLLSKLFCHLYKLGILQNTAHHVGVGTGIHVGHARHAWHSSWHSRLLCCSTPVGGWCRRRCCSSHHCSHVGLHGLSHLCKAGILSNLLCHFLNGGVLQSHGWLSTGCLSCVFRIHKSGIKINPKSNVTALLSQLDAFTRSQGLTARTGATSEIGPVTRTFKMPCNAEKSKGAPPGPPAPGKPGIPPLLSLFPAILQMKMLVTSDHTPD